MNQEFFLNILLLLAVPLSLAIGYGLSYLSNYRKNLNKRNQSQAIIDTALQEGERKVKDIELTAHLKIIEEKRLFEKDMAEAKNDLKNREKKLEEQQESLKNESLNLQNLEKTLNAENENILNLKDELKNKHNQIDKIIKDEINVLEKVSGLTEEAAKKIIEKKLTDSLQEERAKMIKKHQKITLEESARHAQSIIATAIQKCSFEHISEITITKVQLPNEDIKGRVIGREGRNIRALETCTGVNVIVDDTPEIIILSSFDPLRREIARISLEKLIQDGKIHPSEIKKTVEKVETDMASHIKSLGKETVESLDIQDFPEGLLSHLGTLNYKTTHGQNLLDHSKEVSHIMAHLAEELHLDISLCKRIGLLHDIGKSLDHETNGSPSIIGARLLRDYKESETLCESIELHHANSTTTNIYTSLLTAANKVSAHRPGARTPKADEYFLELEKLESLAKTFKGVQKTFALQAGKELCVIVNAEQLDDNQSVLLARDLAHKIEEELSYPDQIKINIIREKKIVEYAT
ncbi:ribonuclease Y [PVC group bacterium (ex Bugula neritina AB1)]|nr:ribonuclease Y [PVC group bacterium (ex Bugula neritina AB1)]